MKIELTKNEVKIIADIFDSFSGQGGIKEFSEKKCHNLSIKLYQKIVNEIKKINKLTGDLE